MIYLMLYIQERMKKGLSEVCLCVYARNVMFLIENMLALPLTILQLGLIAE